jgi:hypothetical protein
MSNSKNSSADLVGEISTAVDTLERKPLGLLVLHAQVVRRALRLAAN